MRIECYVLPFYDIEPIPNGDNALIARADFQDSLHKKSMNDYLGHPWEASSKRLPSDQQWKGQLSPSQRLVSEQVHQPSRKISMLAYPDEDVVLR